MAGKKIDISPPSETRLKEAYYKRYGVYFAQSIIKKVTGQITLSLRDFYNTLSNRGKDPNK